MRNLIHVILATSLVAAPATAVRRTPEEQLAKLVEGRVAGSPVDCISLNLSSSESARIPGIGVAYRQGSTWYVNRFDGDCAELRYNTIVVTHTPSPRLCRGDIADLRSAVAPMPVGSCIFGSFIPYRKVG